MTRFAHRNRLLLRKKRNLFGGHINIGSRECGCVWTVIVCYGASYCNSTAKQIGFFEKEKMASVDTKEKRDRTPGVRQYNTHVQLLPRDLTATVAAADADIGIILGKYRGTSLSIFCQWGLSVKVLLDSIGYNNWRYWQKSEGGLNPSTSIILNQRSASYPV